MASDKPLYVNLALEDEDYQEDNEKDIEFLSKEYENIVQQCGKNADPVYQDFRYGIVCDTLDAFHQRGIHRMKLIQWKLLFPAVYPWNSSYDILRQNVNRRFVLFPWVIAMCKKERHVLNAFREATKYDIPICMRSGSHCYEPYSLIDGMVIDQSRRTKMDIDIKNRILTIQSGVLNGPLADFLSKYNLVLPQGTCANVGVAGLCLGGGLGFLGRKFGLTSDNLLSFNMITSNGKRIKVNEENHPDLFWACKGAGGGNFGIITSFTFRVHPISEIQIFEIWYDDDILEDLIDIWLNWGPDSDRNITTELNVYALNSYRTVKYPVLITGLYVVQDKSLRDLLKPLLRFKPKDFKITNGTYLDAARHFTYQRFPAPFFKNMSTYLYGGLNTHSIQVIRKYMKYAGANDRLEMDGLGGAYNDVPREHSAYPHRGAKAWVQWIARWGSNSDDMSNNPWQDFEQGPKKMKWVESFYTEFMREANRNSEIAKGAYINCPQSELEDWGRAYYGENLDQLISIKKKWDPENKFSFPQGLSQLDES